MILLFGAVNNENPNPIRIRHGIMINSEASSMQKEKIANAAAIQAIPAEASQPPGIWSDNDPVKGEKIAMSTG